MEPAAPTNDLVNDQTNAVYRFAPLAGAVLSLAAVFVAPHGLWIAVGMALGGLAIVAGSLYKSASDERAASGAKLAALGRQNVDLWQRNRALESGKRESDQILGAVRAHLMVVDASYLIQSRYSTELEGVFRQRELGNENFLNVLQRLLSERMFKTARDYMALLFDASRKERVVLKVNPLDEIEISEPDADGVATVRYLNFSFRRIMDEGQIARVLVSVEEITERVTRERQLRDSEQQKVKQFELLIGILHVEPTALDGFVELANAQLGIVDEALNASDFAAATMGQTALLRQRLDVVLQRVHNIKGNASLLRLEHFEKLANTFEQKIIDLRHRPALGGDDFLTVVIGLAAFRADLDDLQALRVKLAGIHRGVEIRNEVGDDLVQGVTQLAKDIAAELGKEVRVDADGFDSRSLPPAQRLIVKDVLIQLTRNSLAHGIEAPLEREGARKPRTATIEIHPIACSTPDTFAFKFRDDGRGLDIAKIRARAIASGLVSRERAAVLGDGDLVQFIFAAGFSTADESSMTAGRGVGMNIVKQRVIDDGNGEIGVDSRPGHYCEFTFALTMQGAPLAAAAAR